MDELKVIVDQRERNQELIAGLRANGLLVEIRVLAVGDYIVSDRIGIERKTVSDFESSIMNGRLFEQVEKLRDIYAFPLIIIEGDRDEFRLKHKVINGTIASIYLDYGMPVVFSHSASDTAEFIASMVKREHQDGVREPSPKGAARAYTNRQFQEYVIGNLPGVGAKLARALLRHFGSVKGIADAGIDELMEVEKIGKKKAIAIHTVLNEEYSESGDSVAGLGQP